MVDRVRLWLIKGGWSIVYDCAIKVQMISGWMAVLFTTSVISSADQKI